MPRTGARVHQARGKCGQHALPNQKARTFRFDPVNDLKSPDFRLAPAPPWRADVPQPDFEELGNPTLVKCGQRRNARQSQPTKGPLY